MGTTVAFSPVESGPNSSQVQIEGGVVVPGSSQLEVEIWVDQTFSQVEVLIETVPALSQLEMKTRLVQASSQVEVKLEVVSISSQVEMEVIASSPEDVEIGVVTAFCRACKLLKLTLHFHPPIGKRNIWQGKKQD